MIEQHRTLSVEVADLKVKKGQKQTPVNRDKGEKTVKPTEEKMDTEDEWDDNMECDDVSVWDIPAEQSTPQPKSQRKGSQVKKTGEKKGTKREAVGKPKGTVDPAKSKQGRSNNTNTNTSQKTRGGKSDRQDPIKVNIEVVSDNDDAVSVTSSSDSEVDPPELKRVRPNSGRPSRDPKRGGKVHTRTSNQQAVEAKLRAIAEEKGEMDMETSECDSSWADLVDEAEAAGGKAEKRADQNERRKNGERKDGKSVRFNEESNSRGVKRAGPQKQGARKKGESVIEKDETSDEDEDSSLSDNESFAEKVSKTAWMKMGKNNKVMEVVATKKRGLRGVKSILQKEIYVQGLDYNGMSNFNEMEKLIHTFCVKRGVQVLFMKIIPAKYDKSQVGCKLAVKEEDFDRVMQDGFWPEFTHVREWKRKPRNGNGQDGQGYDMYQPY